MCRQGVGKAFLAEEQAWHVRELLHPPWLNKCVRHMEGDIGGAGRGQSRTHRVCHNGLELIFDVTRTN